MMIVDGFINDTITISMKQASILLGNGLTFNLKNTKDDFPPVTVAYLITNVYL